MKHPRTILPEWLSEELTGENANRRVAGCILLAIIVYSLLK
jgi:hypothetical protein